MSGSKKRKNSQEVLQKLLEESTVLSLASINQQGQADVSLVPFLYYLDYFWIFVSELSRHTESLGNNPEVSVLVCNTEAGVTNPFSIERLSVACKATLEQQKREQILDLMTVKLGKTVNLLRQLGDFRLFSLAPAQGRLIIGFAQAFEISFPEKNMYPRGWA